MATFAEIDEATEIAERMTLDGITDMDSARAAVRRLMGDETHTVIDNTAEALMWRVKQARPRVRTWNEVTDERYEDMLSCIYPAEWLSHGFLAGEAWDHVKCAVTGDVRAGYTAFVKYQGKHYECLVPVTRREFRLITRETMASELAASPA